MPLDESPRPRLAPIVRTSVAEQIIPRLTGFILDAGLRPGDKLPTERQLMEELGVGRSSLREAIRTLSALGVVRVASGEGMFVGDGRTLLTQPISWRLLMGGDNADEVVEARRLIEVELAGHCAARASAEEVAGIERQLLTMGETLGDPERFTDADAEFHYAIARAARNRVLFQVLETLHNVVRVWIYRNFVQFSDETTQSYQQHVPIYEAIRAGDVEGARLAMAAHIDQATQRLQITIEQDGGRR
ncbi:MAG TPA: FadR/GntR family transcriptional regulator [Candidatus Dormibacteraeota bacterium]|jgi:GntR family transcriptional repressor for pyruvate dehydrogenase complex|nr:FadR/GntR family transcriptional regulator [Candidatus Dormibacteraeota bacterium]